MPVQIVSTARRADAAAGKEAVQQLPGRCPAVSPAQAEVHGRGAASAHGHRKAVVPPHHSVPSWQAAPAAAMDLPALLQAIVGQLHAQEQQQRWQRDAEEAARKLQLVEQQQQQEEQQRLLKEAGERAMLDEVMEEVLQGLWQEHVRGSVPAHQHKQRGQEAVVCLPAWRGESVQAVTPQIMRFPVCYTDQQEKQQQQRQQQQQQQRQRQEEAAAVREKGSKAEQDGLAAVVRRLDALEEENRRLRGMLEASRQREREHAASLEREQRRVKQLRDLLL